MSFEVALSYIDAEIRRTSSGALELVVHRCAAFCTKQLLFFFCEKEIVLVSARVLGPPYLSSAIPGRLDRFACGRYGSRYRPAARGPTMIVQCFSRG